MEMSALAPYVPSRSLWYKTRCALSCWNGEFEHPTPPATLDAALDTSGSPAPSRCFEDSWRGTSRVDGVQLERPPPPLDSPGAIRRAGLPPRRAFSEHPATKGAHRRPWIGSADGGAEWAPRLRALLSGVPVQRSETLRPS